MSIFNQIKEVKIMSANVESMFYVREKPWHGLGVRVEEAPTSIDALVLAGLDWQVTQKNVYTQDGYLIPGYEANIRSTDDSALGIVSDKYKVVQNEDAFQFTDDLLGAGEDAPAVHHCGGRDCAVFGGDELSRWQFWYQGRHDPHPGGLSKHPQPGLE